MSMRTRASKTHQARVARTSLTPALIEAVEAAARRGDAVVDVLTTHGVHRPLFHDWLHVADGRLVAWRDGTPISAAMRARCCELARRLCAVNPKP